jgi:type II secretory pathway component PulC
MPHTAVESPPAAPAADACPRDSLYTDRHPCAGASTLLLTTLEERWGLTPPRLASLTLILLTALLLVPASRWWNTATRASGATSEDAETRAAMAPETVLPVLLSADLFGNAVASGVATPGMIATSNAGFTLRAALAAEGNARAGAIIETSDGAARWYGLNAMVPGGGQLHEIHPQYVVLNRNGALERLDFPALGSTVDVVASEPAAASAIDMAAPESVAGEGAPIPANLAHEEKARLIRQRLEELRNRSRT